MRTDEIIKGRVGGNMILKHGVGKNDCVWLVYIMGTEYGKRYVCHTEEEAIKVYNEAA